jgi:hypothetical protein
MYYYLIETGQHGNGDSRHYNHECDVAQNSNDGHRKLYRVREAGHQTTSTEECGVRQEISNRPHTVSSDTKDGPETLYPRNGSFVPVSNFVSDKDIRRSRGLWQIFFLW